MIHARHFAHMPLHLDLLAPETDLARRLPAEVAFAYCAFPVAREGDQIAIAMANPEDREARTHLQEILGPELFFVHADAQQIKDALFEIWPQHTIHSDSILVCGSQRKIQAHGSYLRHWVDWMDIGGLEVRPVEHLAGINQAIADLPSQNQDLVIVLPPELSKKERILHGVYPKAIFKRPDVAFLLVRQSQWPLRRILLIPPLSRGKHAFAAWVVRMATLTECEVTVLAVTPPVPGMYQGLPRMGADLSEMMSTRTAAGMQLRHLAALLEMNDVHAAIRLRQGALRWQILQELHADDYDLVMVASQPTGFLERQREGGVCKFLLGCCDCPLLVVPAQEMDVLNASGSVEEGSSQGRQFDEAAWEDI